MKPTRTQAEGRWLLLIHQIPPKPNYFRVKVGRRLARLGAVAIKNSVYALPKNEQTQEDFQWVLREIVQEGGDASLVEARFIEGMSDAAVEALFHAARDAEYAELGTEVRELARSLGSKKLDADRRAAAQTDVVRFQRRLSEILALDFFAAPGRQGVESLIRELEARLEEGASPAPTPAGTRREDYQGRTWVTRTGIHIDRIASAWLIRRFIDPEARLKFVPSKGYRPERGEVRFDMFDAEFTHEGDDCTFEVLVRRFHLRDGALEPIAQIIHDLDLKDAKFARQDALGIDRLILGIAMSHPEDEARLARGSAVFDDLYGYFKRKP